MFVLILVAILAINCNNTNTKGQVAADSSTAVAKTDSVAPPVPAKPEITPITIDSTKRYIFLTFDDGPQPPGSVNCFRIFRELGLKATFFTIAEHVEGRERENLIDTIRSSYPNYLLANHSKTHAFNDRYIYFYHHPHEALLDFLACQEKLKVPFKIVRLPGNSAWVRQGEVKAAPLVKPVCILLDSAGYNVIGWDEEWGFKTVNHESVPVQSAERMARMIDEDLSLHQTHSRNMLVLLAHDRMFAHANYADSLYKCLSILKKDPRNVFETIDHYPGIKPNN